MLNIESFSSTGSPNNTADFANVDKFLLAADCKYAKLLYVTFSWISNGKLRFKERTSNIFFNRRCK